MQPAGIVLVKCHTARGTKEAITDRVMVVLISTHADTKNLRKRATGEKDAVLAPVWKGPKS